MVLLWDVEVLGIRGHGLIVGCRCFCIRGHGFNVGCRGPWYQRSWSYLRDVGGIRGDCPVSGPCAPLYQSSWSHWGILRSLVSQIIVSFGYWGTWYQRLWSCWDPRCQGSWSHWGKLRNLIGLLNWNLEVKWHGWAYMKNMKIITSDHDTMENVSTSFSIVMWVWLCDKLHWISVYMGIHLIQQVWCEWIGSVVCLQTCRDFSDAHPCSVLEIQCSKLDQKVVSPPALYL